MQADWELSQAFPSLDEGGIRCACVLNQSSDVETYRLVAGTQNGGLFVCSVPSGDMVPIPYQHNHAVSALVASEDKSIFVTGCKDAVVRVFDSQTFSLRFALEGHDKPVTSLSWCKDGKGSPYLISGSWDGTAKIWNIETGNLIATLSGHENSVCCAGLPPRSDTSLKLVTGSAGYSENNTIKDHSVRIWEVDLQSGQFQMLQHVANDHDGPIRGLDYLQSSNSIVTCSNDGTVKVRDSTHLKASSTLMFIPETNQSQPPMLLNVTAVGLSSVGACAEDGHLVIWSLEDTSQPQKLLHPDCVWSVLSLPNSDIATCCDDRTMRIFTQCTERIAPQAVLDAFAQDVSAARQRTSGGPTPEEIAKLPRWESNFQHQGSSEGQVQVFQKGGVAIAAQWSSASQTWIEVGQVTGTKENDTGAIDGVQYDHVFPIEVDQTGGGVAKLQIGYNTGENPFAAAQRFIDKHMLPQHHLAEIADYIQKRAGAPAPTIGQTSEAGVSFAGSPIASFEHIPIRTYKVFDLPEKNAVKTLTKIKSKLQESGKLSAAQVDLVETLTETLAATSRYHSSTIPIDCINIIAHVLHSFPPEEAFPALDLARMTVLHPDAAARSRMSHWSGVLDMILLLDVKRQYEGAAAVAIPLLTIRLFANCFKGGPGVQEAIADRLIPAIAFTTSFVGSTNKNVRLSVTTFLHNIAFFVNQTGSSNLSIATAALALANDILSASSYEGEAVMRTIQAIGTIALSSPDAKHAANSLSLVSKVEPAVSPHDETVKAVAKEVYLALQ